MKFSILTIFPEMFEILNKSVIGRAEKNNLIELEVINIRDFAIDKHNTVDDTPYGGGAGMLMKADIVYNSIASVKQKDSKIIYLSPKGKTLTQEKVKELISEKHLVLLAGHYEGIDQRIIDNYIDEEISVGDYILTGGEIPAMILVDSVARLVEGVISKDSVDDSFENNLLEYPQYTRPETFNNIEIPEVLKSGNHKEIADWRRKESLKITFLRRPDLLEKAILTNEDKEYIDKLKKQNEENKS